MKVLGIIPARYSSTRFPGKPLVVIDGKSMIRRVYEQALSCKALSDVIVATDDLSIETHVVSFGGKAMMTSAGHRSGTERCSEVCDVLRSRGMEYDVIVNIQGDEPYIHPGQIEQVTGCFSLKDATIVSLMKKISSADELRNPDVVKVLAGLYGNALYFSRAPVPFVRGVEAGEWLGRHDFFKHIGIYGFRPEILEKIVKLPLSPLETAESLEQLRWLENGYKIRLVETAWESVAIDSPADLLKLTNRG